MAPVCQGPARAAMPRHCAQRRAGTPWFLRARPGQAVAARGLVGVVMRISRQDPGPNGAWSVLRRVSARARAVRGMSMRGLVIDPGGAFADPLAEAYQSKHRCA